MKLDFPEYEDAKPHEQSLMHLMSCVNGKYESDYMGLQKLNLFDLLMTLT